MKIHLLSLGTKLPHWVNDGVSTYQKRFTHPFQLTMTELPIEKRRSNSHIEQIKQKEAADIQAALPKNTCLIALDETGKSFTTQQLAQQLSEWQLTEKSLSFVIGGPDGLDKAFKESANLCWSLSPLTFPHPLARLILVEQLYRAITILQNHPYHRS